MVRLPALGSGHQATPTLRLWSARDPTLVSTCGSAAGAPVLSPDSSVRPGLQFLSQNTGSSVSRLFSPPRTLVPSSEHGHSERQGRGPRALLRDMRQQVVLGFPPSPQFSGNLSQSRPNTTALTPLYLWSLAFRIQI